MGLGKDLRYAMRALLRAPGFSAIAVLTLALAIGANTAIFSVANGLLLKPLPLPAPERLIDLLRGFPQGDGSSISIPKYVYWRAHGEPFEEIAAYDELGLGFNLAVGDGPPERILGTRVSSGFFRVFRAGPLRGRTFLAEEDRPGGARVVVLSHGLWLRRFGGDPSVVGRPLVLNGESYTVVGVMPGWFKYPSGAELWAPFALDPASTDNAHYFRVTGRLKPGVSLASAQARMRVVGRLFAAAHPGLVDLHETIKLKPLQETLYGDLKPAVLVLLAAVGAVLLIACVNVANLQLVRAAGRQREIAIRAVLGSSSGRIVRQLLAESLLLSLAGGAAGLLAGAASIRPLLAASPVTLDRLAPVGIDGRVLAFTFVVAVAAGLLSGLAPALQCARGNLHEPLKEGSNRTAGAAGKLWMRRLLVISEVALALVLFTVATLFMRSFMGLLSTDPGFTPARVLTAKLSLPEARYGTPEALGRLSDSLVERVRALPGVAAAATSSTLPLEPGPDLPFVIEGRYHGGREGFEDAQYRAFSPGYLEVLGIPVLSGRSFVAGDRLGAPLVAMVNRAAVRRFWGGKDPVGQRITIGAPILPDLRDMGPRTIVGVLGDVRETGLDEKAPPVLYVPLAQLPAGVERLLVRLLPVCLAVRTSVAGPGSGALAQALRQQVWAVDPRQPVSDLRSMEEVLHRSLGARRFVTTLLGIMALLALSLAALGIYGVLSYLVHARTREIGVRMALGANAASVLRLVLRQGLAPVLAGITAGLAGALAVTRLLQGLLYGISPQDPATFLLTPAVLCAVALYACSLPALRACRLDPVAALGQE